MTKQFHIKRVKAQNFLCFGEDGIDIDFEQKSNIILLHGRNEDIPEDNEEERIASNGVGKSSIAETIVYGLTGTTIRKFPKAENVVNNKNSKTMRLEIWVDNLRIVRTRGKSATITVFEMIDGKEVDKTCGTMKDTQAWIDDQLHIQSVPALVNLLVFTDNNAGSFLESDTEDRRTQAETNFNLSIYAKYHDAANKLLTTVKNNIKFITTELTAAEKNVTKADINLERAKTQDVEWKKIKAAEVQSLITIYKIKEQEISSSDVGAALLKYDEAQKKLQELMEIAPPKETALKETQEGLIEARSKGEKIRANKNEITLAIQQLKSDAIASKNKLTEAETSISNIESKRCPHCLKLPVAGEDAETLKLNYQKLIDVETQKIIELKNALLLKEDELGKCNSSQKELEDITKNIEAKFTELNSEINTLRKQASEYSKVEKPEISLNEKLLQSELADLGKQILAKKTEADGPSPYVENIKNAADEKEERLKELDDKKNELNEVSRSIQLYEFWRKAFGDTGIRKFVIDGIIPVLNERIYYWLKFLIDNKLTLQFDNALKEQIERNPADGDPFVYSAMSGGERRRLNLAVASAMSYVTSTMTGTCPSIIVLDEVTTNIDPIGVQGVYNMIVELSKERKVIVTTHDQTLQQMLEGYDTINLVKKDGISTIEISN